MKAITRNKVDAALESRQDEPTIPNGHASKPALPQQGREIAVPPAPANNRIHDLLLDGCFAAIADKERKFQQRYEVFKTSAKRLPRIRRAEAWLQFVSREIDSWGEAEALVYLVSRGFDCSTAIATVRQSWAEAAHVATFDGQPITEQTTNLNPTGSVDAVQVEQSTTTEVPDFWEGTDRQVHSIDATMLRTAEWCKLRGFAPWFRRLDRTQYEEILLCGSDPEVRIRSLVNLCRSPLAIRTMQRSLPLAMKVVELTQSGQPTPWTSEGHVRSSSGVELKTVENLEFAAGLIFCVHRVRRPGHPAYRLMPAAVECLRKHQHADGSWALTSLHDGGSVKATAMALHALAVSRPRGSKKMMMAAVKWLLGQQEDAGNWYDTSAYVNSVYLTVLVLDAIAAAKGERCVTYLGRHGIKHGRPARTSPRRRP